MDKTAHTLSYSSLKEFMKSPAHFIAYKNKQKVETAAMRLGTAVHSAILEPDEYASLYAATDLRKNTKAYKELDTSKIWLNMSDYKTVEGCKRGVADNAEASSLLSYCKNREQEVTGVINGVPFRGFCDAMNSTTVIDLKTTQDASPEQFTRSAYNFAYHLQAAIYLELTGAERYCILAVETSAPYASVLYEFDSSFLDSGYAMLQKGIAAYRDWDGVAAGYDKYNGHKLELPRWAK